MITRIASVVTYVVVPVVGILAFGWDWRSVIVLYWLENVATGLRTIVSMLRAERMHDPNSGTGTNRMRFTVNGVEPAFLNPDTSGPEGNRARLSTRLGFAGFFTFHYGLFTLVHGIFVSLMILGLFNMMFGFARMAGSSPGSGLRPGSGETLSETLVALDLPMVLAVWAVGTIVQLVIELMQPRSALPALSTLFRAPYSRILVLHITIIVGAALIGYFGWPPIAAILLVALHLLMDLRQLRQLRQQAVQK